MDNIEKLREQLNVLEAKEDELRQQRMANLDEISHIEELIKAEERKLANNNVMPFVGKYVKCTQTDAFGNSIIKYIHVDKVQQKDEFYTEFIIRGQLVQLVRSNNEVTCYHYDKDYQCEITLDWNDPFNGYFKLEDLTEIYKQEFIRAKNSIKRILYHEHTN